MTDEQLARNIVGLHAAMNFGPMTDSLIAHIADALRAVRAEARNEGLEMAACVADRNKGAAKRKRIESGLALSRMPIAEREEIFAEERGEDIASHVIAAAIRELKGE